MKATLILAALALWAGAGDIAWAKDCRVDEAPPGVRVPDRPGCKPSLAASSAKKAERQGERSGLINLGNGTEVRVSGRVRIETRAGR